MGVEQWIAIFVSRLEWLKWVLVVSCLSSFVGAVPKSCLFKQMFELLLILVESVLLPCCFTFIIVDSNNQGE